MHQNVLFELVAISVVAHNGLKAGHISVCWLFGFFFIVLPRLVFGKNLPILGIISGWINVALLEA